MFTLGAFKWSQRFVAKSACVKVQEGYCLIFAKWKNKELTQMEVYVFQQMKIIKLSSFKQPSVGYTFLSLVLLGVLISNPDQQEKA